MKPSPYSIIALTLAFTASAGSSPTFVPLGSSSYRFDWTGEVGITYFVQDSQDMQSWRYFPLIEHGLLHDPLNVTPLDGNNVPLEKYFMRLVQTDIPTLDPEGDDFDSDGLPNLYELDTVASDPLDGTSAGADSDNDGMPDGWEMYFFGNLTAVAATVGQPDGLSNLEKAQLGLSPLVNYNNYVADKNETYQYDLVGRLTSVEAPDTAVTFTPDTEGNILNAQ